MAGQTGRQTDRDNGLLWRGWRPNRLMIILETSRNWIYFNTPPTRFGRLDDDDATEASFLETITVLYIGQHNVMDSVLHFSRMNALKSFSFLCSKFDNVRLCRLPLSVPSPGMPWQLPSVRESLLSNERHATLGIIVGPPHCRWVNNLDSGESLLRIYLI